MQTTVSELIDRAKAASDMHDDFVTQAQWVTWANVEHRALQIFLARSGYSPEIQSDTIVANGAGGYTTAEPLAVVAVFEQMTDGRYRRLKQDNFAEGNRQVDGATAPNRGAATMYTLTYSPASERYNIHFYPEPDNGTYVVFFVPQPATLTVSDSVFLPAGWEEWIVLGMARRALAKEEGDTRQVDKERQRIEQTVEEANWARVLSQAPKIRNVDRIERGWVPGSSHWPPPVGEWYFPF